MESDSDYELEEETLLHVEVAGVLQEDLALSPDTPLRFIDLESARPLVQVGNQVFSGAYEHTVGTSLLFRQKENTEPVDEVFGRHVVSTKVEYLASTQKKLKLKRVFLKAKPDTANQKQETQQPLLSSDNIKTSENKKSAAAENAQFSAAAAAGTLRS